MEKNKKGMSNCFLLLYKAPTISSRGFIVSIVFVTLWLQTISVFLQEISAAKNFSFRSFVPLFYFSYFCNGKKWYLTIFSN